MTPKRTTPQASRHEAVPAARTKASTPGAPTTLKGHFDGKQIVLDEPPPPGLPLNARVTVHIENGQPASNGQHATGPTLAFDALLGVAKN